MVEKFHHRRGGLVVDFPETDDCVACTRHLESSLQTEHPFAAGNFAQAGIACREDDELGAVQWTAGRYDDARSLLDDLLFGDEYAEYLTIPAYELL